MAVEKEKTFMDFIKLFSRDTSSNVIGDFGQVRLGGRVVFDSPELHSNSFFEGGFK
jgi:hypothetical protein